MIDNKLTREELNDENWHLLKSLSHLTFKYEKLWKFIDEKGGKELTKEAVDYINK